jgi:hypothetical protein
MQAIETPSPRSAWDIFRLASEGLLRKTHACDLTATRRQADSGGSRTRRRWRDLLPSLQRQPDAEALPAAAKHAFAVEAKSRALGRPVPSRYY